MAIVAVAAGVLSAPGLTAPLEATSFYDGGITSSAGTFILHGQVPYRDFWLLYGPLTAYVAAAVNAVFGNQVLALRLAGLLLVVLTAIVGYRLIVDVAPGIRGACVAVLAATIPRTVGPMTCEGPSPPPLTVDADPHAAVWQPASR